MHTRRGGYTGFTDAAFATVKKDSHSRLMRPITLRRSLSRAAPTTSPIQPFDTTNEDEKIRFFRFLRLAA